MFKNEMSDSWVAGRPTHSKAVLHGKFAFVVCFCIPGTGWIFGGLASVPIYSFSQKVSNELFPGARLSARYWTNHSSLNHLTIIYWISMMCQTMFWSLVNKTDEESAFTAFIFSWGNLNKHKHDGHLRGSRKVLNRPFKIRWYNSNMVAYLSLAGREGFLEKVTCVLRYEWQEK